VTTNQYDEKLSGAYARTKENPSPLQTLCYQNFTRAVGSTDALAVCDLGCGAGHSTRLLRELGTPKRLVGFDLSDEMIGQANEMEIRESLGIEYRGIDCTSIPTDLHGQFDLATAMWLLHYAESREALDGFAASIASILQPGGRFVGVVQDKFVLDERSRHFGETRQWIGDPGQEGAQQRIIVTDLDSTEICSFTIWCWNRHFYEQALSTAGFKDIIWQDLTFDEATRMQFPEWQLIESLASCSLLTARL
jgi:toxoflavin synthase